MRSSLNSSAADAYFRVPDRGGEEWAEPVVSPFDDSPLEVEAGDDQARACETLAVASGGDRRLSPAAPWSITPT